MNANSLDVDRCNRPEKEVCEGLCLSYDLLSGLCTDSGSPCDALLELDEILDENEDE